ncbi:MAG TPA: glycerol-3-phosphate responsive antiterminator [Tissierellaceae bacterium]|nr:glycerol-3-phosphate responsive antiterminator [Tissierellaceae bacterium]
MKHFFDRISENPVIASIYDLDALNLALDSPCEIIFLLTGNIFNLKEIANKVRKANKGLYILVDSIDGFSKDTWGLEYIVKNICPDGIITEKNYLIKLSKDMGVFTIQRLYISDSYALKKDLDSIKKNRPNAVELLPGIVPAIISQVIKETKISLIASGLIRNKDGMNLAFKAGAIGISTSKKDIWYV